MFLFDFLQLFNETCFQEASCFKCFLGDKACQLDISLGRERVKWRFITSEHAWREGKGGSDSRTTV